MRHLHGQLFKPSASTVEEYEKIYERSEFYTPANFSHEYRKHIVAMEHVAECAKSYILKNWERIDSWKDLHLLVKDNTGEVTEYYDYTPCSRENWSDTLSELFEEIDQKRQKAHNPVESLTGVVLDPTDGDFSFTINGKDHLWVDDETVIVLANFIETKLKDEPESELPTEETQAG